MATAASHTTLDAIKDADAVSVRFTKPDDPIRLTVALNAALRDAARRFPGESLRITGSTVRDDEWELFIQAAKEVNFAQ